MEESHSFGPLLIVVVLAFAVPLVLTRFKRLSAPVVVGEILAGVIIGSSGLQLVGHDQILDILALLGFASLMFLSGLEVDFDAILPRAGVWQGSWRERLSNPLSLGMLIFFLAVCLALLGGWALHSLDTADDPWLMAMILATTSLGVVVPVLKERDLLGQPYGRSLLVTAAQEAGLVVVEADAVEGTTWRALEPETIRAAAVLLPGDEANLLVSRMLREEMGIQRVVSRVQDATQSAPFNEMDVQVINPSLSPVVELEYLLLFPSVSSLMADLGRARHCRGAAGLPRPQRPAAARPGTA